MRWWQFAFPSTSCARSSHHDNHRQKLSSRSVKSQQRRLTRVRKLRHLTDHDIGIVPEPSLSLDLWRFPSRADRLSPQRSSFSSTAVPQPLPVPELSFLLRRDTLSPSSTSSHSISTSIPLPSPKDTSTSSRGGEERERADTSTGDGKADGVAPSAGVGSKSACPNAKKVAEHADGRSSRKAPQELKDGERTGSCRFHIPISAPTTPFSSPGLSPQRSNGDTHMSPYTSPQVFQVWSAPEMPPLDMALSPGCPYQMYSEISAYSVDNSPLHSPLTSPCRNARSPTGPASPLNNRLSLEGQTSWRENNSQANVHPLPLPPAASPPLQPAIGSQVTAKPDLMPMNDKWQKGKLIGRGTFGSVYVATNRETGALCAMKEVEILQDDPKSAECMKQLEQEIKVLSHLKHPNIVQYYGSEIVGDKFYIYLEYVYPGSINKYIRDHCGAITESVVRNFTRHIVSGLAYLHSTKTIHRDIKGANLLVDASGVVKLADFGMAKHLAGQAADLSLKGSPHWMAPELLLSVMKKNASSDLALAVDIWSLGCTVIEMLNGKPPWSEYEGPAAMFKVLREHPPIPKTLSAEGKHFLRCCFRRNPADRPTANMLLEHQFLKNSQPLDVPHVTQALCGMTLTDKVHASAEHYNYKHDQLSASPEAQTMIGKPGNE